MLTSRKHHLLGRSDPNASASAANASAARANAAAGGGRPATEMAQERAAKEERAEATARARRGSWRRSSVSVLALLAAAVLARLFCASDSSHLDSLVDTVSVTGGRPTQTGSVASSTSSSTKDKTLDAAVRETQRGGSVLLPGSDATATATRNSHTQASNAKDEQRGPPDTPPAKGTRSINARERRKGNNTERRARNKKKTPMPSWDLLLERTDDEFLHAGTYRGLATPEQAAANLQNQTWVESLQITVGGRPKCRLRSSAESRGCRVVCWSVGGCSNEDNLRKVEFVLHPYMFRSSLLIELLVDGKVMPTMGENIVMLGWAKVALALGCRVVLFESGFDFLAYIHSTARTRRQVYVLDHLSLPWARHVVLAEERLRRRTWCFHYWGVGRGSADEWNLTGFDLAHALIPYNYTRRPGSPAENVRMGVLPTSVTMNHVHEEETRGESSRHRCDAFFMGKNVENVEALIPLVKITEDKLHLSPLPSKKVTLCTGFKLPKNATLDEFLGFTPRYTVNVGRTKPWVFSDLVGSARVVIGSGSPRMPPTITDTIFGGGVFMAPAKQFSHMEDHPLFVKTDQRFQSLDDQSDHIIRLILSDVKQEPFGGYRDTSYDIAHVCRQVLRIIEASWK